MRKGHDGGEKLVQQSGGAWIYSHFWGGDITMNGDHPKEGDHQRMVTFKG